MSLDGNGRYCALDPREGTKLIVAECCRNLSTVGALPVAATNNLNFGNPERPEIMAQLVESIEGMAEACRFFETPITGGNVSLYNETLGDADLADAGDGYRRNVEDRACRSAFPFKSEGRAVMLLGGYGASRRRRNSAARQYAKVDPEHDVGFSAALDMEYEKRVQAAIRELVRRRAGGIGARSERWRPGGSAGRMLVWAEHVGARCRARYRSASGIAAVSRRSVAHSGFDSGPKRVVRDCAKNGSKRCNRRYNRRRGYDS